MSRNKKSLGRRLLPALVCLLAVGGQGCRGTSVSWQSPPPAVPSAGAGAGLSLDLVRVPGGEFMMGSPVGGRSDERPVHAVKVRDFLLGKYEVSWSQWKQVMGPAAPGKGDCELCPVNSVTWTQVQEFLRKAGPAAGTVLRLPTEAEWEYAAGGGTAHQTWAGTSDLGALGGYAWYTANAGGMSRPVGTKMPNAFGLHDMSGNVWEWCSDWYGAGYYAVSPGADPGGPASGSAKVVRGGGWDFPPDYLKTANRFMVAPDKGNASLGLRVAADVAPRVYGAQAP